MPCPIFAALPQPQLEQLVNALQPVDPVRSGGTVVIQGEPGEQCFVIVSDSARILRDGVEVALLGPGEGFGEIALLRPGPRRATVQAEGPLKLLALKREPFLLAVTGSTASLEAVNRTIETLLAPDHDGCGRERDTRDRDR